MKEFLTRLYWIFVGFYFASLFIVILYDNPIPAYVALTMMLLSSLLKNTMKAKNK